MNLGLIEYLEGKNFDVEEIVALQKIIIIEKQPMKK